MSSPRSPKEMEASREATHGDAEKGMRNLALVWTGLLRDHYQIELPLLSPHVTSLMCVGLKLSRAARPFNFTPDDYDDAGAYLEFARRLEDPNREHSS